MFRAYLNLLLWMDRVGLLLLLMIVPGTWVYLMKSKSEVNLLFQNFHKMVCSQYNAQVQVLRSDNGGEYFSFELKQYLEAHGTIHQTTCFDIPQQNGVAERKNCHLLEVVHASLIEAHMPLSY